MKRRNFVKTLTQTGVVLSAGGWVNELLLPKESVKLTILHTNDVHSRINPFPQNAGRNAGLGGAARRAAMIEKIRAEESNVLLLDAGDIFQGTPYFNFFGGELEFKLMSEMKYDAATIGNHDFDAGIEGLYKQLPHSHFPLVISNYDFSDTIMHDQTKPYEIFVKQGVKIGVFGLGIELEGLVPQSLYKNTIYQDPIAIARRMSSILKNDLDCDYIICLSHLGNKYRDETVSDHVLAATTQDIDLIIGGHTHTFLSRPELLKNVEGDPVIVNQVGWGGMYLGRIDVFFEKSKRRRCQNCQNLAIT